MARRWWNEWRIGWHDACNSRSVMTRASQLHSGRGGLRPGAVILGGGVLVTLTFLGGCSMSDSYEGGERWIMRAEVHQEGAITGEACGIRHSIEGDWLPTGAVTIEAPVGSEVLVRHFPRLVHKMTLDPPLGGGDEYWCSNEDNEHVEGSSGGAVECLRQFAGTEAARMISAEPILGEVRWDGTRGSIGYEVRLRILGPGVVRYTHDEACLEQHEPHLYNPTVPHTIEVVERMRSEDGGSCSVGKVDQAGQCWSWVVAVGLAQVARRRGSARVRAAREQPTPD